MDEKMPDAVPLTQNFLVSLASFMEQEHQLMGDGDISSQVKVAIATQASEGKAEPQPLQNSDFATLENHLSQANHNSKPGS